MENNGLGGVERKYEMACFEMRMISQDIRLKLKYTEIALWEKNYKEEGGIEQQKMRGQYFAR